MAGYKGASGKLVDSDYLYRTLKAEDDRRNEKLHESLFVDHETVPMHYVLADLQDGSEGLEIVTDGGVTSADTQVEESVVNANKLPDDLTTYTVGQYVNKIEEITIELLQKNKIKALILDVDNTLVNYNKEMPKRIEKWAKELKGQGTKLYIVSNSNDKEKVKKVSKKLGNIPYTYFAMKPLKKGLKIAQNQLNEKPENIAVVGDQIFVREWQT